MALLEILDEAGTRGLPSDELTCEHARGRAVSCEEVGHPGEVLSAFSGETETTGTSRWRPMIPAIPYRHALIGHPVQSRSRRGLLQGQAEKARRVEPVNGGPAVGPLGDVAGDALVTGDADKGRDEAVVSLAVVRRRESHTEERTPREARESTNSAVAHRVRGPLPQAAAVGAVRDRPVRSPHAPSQARGSPRR